MKMVRRRAPCHGTSKATTAPDPRPCVVAAVAVVFSCLPRCCWWFVGLTEDAPAPVSRRRVLFLGLQTSHAAAGVEKGLASKNGLPIEIMGLMTGHVDTEQDFSLVITDVFPLPVEGTETTALADSDVVMGYMTSLSDSLEKVPHPVCPPGGMPPASCRCMLWQCQRGCSVVPGIGVSGGPCAFLVAEVLAVDCSRH